MFKNWKILVVRQRNWTMRKYCIVYVYWNRLTILNPIAPERRSYFLKKIDDDRQFFETKNKNRIMI